MDGVDAAIIRTDGEDLVEFGPWLTEPYPGLVRVGLKAILGQDAASSESREVEQAVTDQHAFVISRLLEKESISISEIDVIGFHGHTVVHRPDRRFTWQLGDAAGLATKLGRTVVGDFRAADVAAGGQGAPFAPLFHRALASSLSPPLAVLNIGGVANVTWIGQDEILSFDTGPGNALLDDWVARHDAGPFDENGRLAASGLAEPHLLSDLLGEDYFTKAPPKSLDRTDFDLAALSGLSPEDGAATLVGFTVGAIMAAQDHFPRPANRWLVTGGGRHNGYMMALLKAGLDVAVDPVEAVGWQGDALEAQAFAYLAVRSLQGLPLSLPSTTGVPVPTCGGKHFRPEA